MNDMLENAQFGNGDRVLCNMGDGKEHKGTIRGIATRHIVDFYIVELDGRPFDNYPYDCITMVESCLTRDPANL